MLFFLVLLLSLNLAESSTTPSTDPYRINFGLSQTMASGGTWRSDQEFLVTSPTTTATTTLAVSDIDPPYDVARKFEAQTNYSIRDVSSGAKLIRLYLYPPTSTLYNDMDTTKSLLSLKINGIEILSNFSGFIVAANANANSHTTVQASAGLVREVYLTVNNDDSGKAAIHFTFSPSIKGGFGFINGVEVVSVPDGLYVNSSSAPIPFLVGNPQDYINSNYNFPEDYTTFAMENVIRLNIGGLSVRPQDDNTTGRTWYPDDKFLQFAGKNPSYNDYRGNISTGLIKCTISTRCAAPERVYSTARSVGPYALVRNKNLTWALEVDLGFSYLVRLHFCDILAQNKEEGDVVFDININNQTAFNAFDVFRDAGGQYIAMYRDCVTNVSSDVDTKIGSGSSRVLLWVKLLAHNSLYHDAYLNGLEIFKLSSNSSLAAPNPPLPKGVSPPSQNVSAHKGKATSKYLLPIVGGVLGFSLVSLAILACFIIMCRRIKAKKKSVDGTSTQNSSKLKWISMLGGDSGSTATTTSVVSSLPSDLCRHFSLAQIRIATCDFDKKLILGKGGFGDVYKGSIIDAVDGTIQVAVKRLHTKSKQGANEFQTEIEMLSRLRHMHLVSLIGYCEDEGEMILVYEYMSRGTVRDHLMYKNSERNDPNKTPLSWKQRLMICIGSARGLHYLHAGARQLIIHRDVKTTNILLDDKWTAKVSDFGLSKAGPISLGMGPTHISTAVKGSAGYLDPEYYRNHQLTEKSDVYSFGVVLFEILCARAAVNPNLPKEQANLAMWAQSHYKKGTLNTIVDKNIASQIAPECLRKFGEIAEICVRDRGSERPSMGDVVWGLEFAQQLQETAEKNNSLSGGSLAEVMGSTWDSKLDIGGDGNTDNEVFTNSGDNCSRSSNGGVAEKSEATTSSSSDYRVNMISDSVFSDIIDPTAR